MWTLPTNFAAPPKFAAEHLQHVDGDHLMESAAIFSFKNVGKLLPCL